MIDSLLELDYHNNSNGDCFLNMIFKFVHDVYTLNSTRYWQKKKRSLISFCFFFLLNLTVHFFRKYQYVCYSVKDGLEATTGFCEHLCMPPFCLQPLIN